MRSLILLLVCSISLTLVGKDEGIFNRTQGNEASEVKTIDKKQGLPAALRKVRFLLLPDVKAANIGETTEKDGELIKALIDYIFNNDDFPRLQGKATVHSLKRLSRADITAYFEKYPLTTGEAVVIYYSGHGAYDNKILGGHYLNLSSDEDFERWELRGLVEAKSPLTILITDACASFAAFQRQIPKGSEEELEARQEMYEGLFLRHRGVMDFNSSSIGEASWTTSSGSMMTLSLLNTLTQKSVEKLDLNKDSFISWVEIFLDVKTDTANLFTAVRERAIKYAQANNEKLPAISEAKSQVPPGGFLGV